MFEFFTRRMKPFIGIDIGTASIKVVELAKFKDTIILKNIGYAPLQEGAIVDHTIHNVDAVGDAISLAIKGANIKIKHAAIAMPEALIINKAIHVNESLTENEIDSQIINNLDQYIPSASLDNISLDFQVIPEKEEEKQKSKKKVMIIACKQQGIDTRLEACAKAGINTSIVDTEILALNRVLFKKIGTSELPNCYADLGHASIKFFAVKFNEIIFSKELKFGAMNLFDNIKNAYGLTTEQAKQKYFNEKLPKDYETNIEIPFCSAIANQISQLIQFFYSAKKEFDFSKLYISGVCSGRANLHNALKKKLNKPIENVEPISQLKHELKLNNHLLNLSSIFNIAYGLALRSLINDKH